MILSFPFFVNRKQMDWYSVTVNKSPSSAAPLNRAIINEDSLWRVKMWKRIQQNYSRAGYYSLIAPPIEGWLLKKSESPAALNITFIRMICDVLGFSKEFLLSSQFPSSAQRSQRVVELLRLTDADSYYCVKGSFEYMLADGLFLISDAEVLFQYFRPHAYFQAGLPDNFISYLSGLDALMNAASERTEKFISQGTSKWLTWDEMKTRRTELLREKLLERNYYEE
jgi:hypothetical protein